MSALERYRKRVTSVITAVRLDLKTDGFAYEKWGATQRCKAGDWLVDNGGDVYTIDADVFARTYKPATTPGCYVKTTVVFARKAEKAGVIQSKEGATHYETGDYIVYNEADEKDGYAVETKRFEEMYEPVGEG
ncbi:MAG: hypothetical protein AAGA21_02315 [Pseudomonadota bacterium]